MTINTLYNLTDYDTNSNVTEDNVEFHTTSPCFLMDHTLTPYILKDLTRSHNESITTYFKTTDVINFKIQVLFGSNVTGTGYAFSIEHGLIKLVTTTTFTESSILISKDISNIIEFTNDTYYPLKILIVNDKIELYINNLLLIEYIGFTAIDNNIGYHLNGGTANVYISDTIYYDDQIIWGNINLNGQNNEDGIALLFSQLSIEFLTDSRCDENGNWMIFIEEDPVQQNKHILIGEITSKEYLQPKGISNITL